LNKSSEEKPKSVLSTKDISTNTKVSHSTDIANKYDKPEQLLNADIVFLDIHRDFRAIDAVLRNGGEKGHLLEFLHARDAWAPILSTESEPAPE
jgi:hypothetical protein